MDANPHCGAGLSGFVPHPQAAMLCRMRSLFHFAFNVTDLDEVAPVFAAGSNTSASMAENSPTSTVVHTATASDNVGVTGYSFEAGGADNAKFSLNTSTADSKALSVSTLTSTADSKSTSAAVRVSVCESRATRTGW